MMLLAALFATGSGLSMLASGYVFGARSGRQARAALDREIDTREAKLHSLEARIESESASRGELEARAAAKQELASVVSAVTAREDATVLRLREELGRLQSVVDDRAKSTEALHHDIKASLANLARQSPDAAKLQKELTRLVTPLLEREADAKGLRETVREVIAPMLERDRLGRALSEVKAGEGLAELAPVLQAISQTGGFEVVLLSDDSGLPLAASRDAEAIDVLAGVSSLLLNFADRSQQSGRAVPTAVVTQDAADRLTLHRIFFAGPSRYVLTAVTRGLYLSPRALDPALVTIQRILGQRDDAA